ncbi:hypothetical protein RR46_14131 [Papilio xuthus]|uniref:Uncharacterized protein n=1 Tax=Papilio xuthus TaxID=66420 RepID=A0A194PP54_PAPXU|nr:hypothetical protein RR46_14131 [Papilio xuthus]
MRGEAGGARGKAGGARSNSGSYPPISAAYWLPPSNPTPYHVPVGMCGTAGYVFAATFADLAARISKSKALARH